MIRTRCPQAAAALRRPSVTRWSRITVAVAALSGWTTSPAHGLRVPASFVQQVPEDTIPLPALEVTVLRTPFQQNAAPFAVSAVQGEELRRGKSGVFLQETLQGLPGVQVQSRFNPAVGDRIAIRGFGARAQFGLRGIRVLVDGIPATLPDGQSTLDHLDVATLGRVEALRGPGSAIFGNASGGVLSFSTRRPSLAPFDLEVEGLGGSNGLARGQVTASGTVGRTGYLITGSKQTWDGYRDICPTSAPSCPGASSGSFRSDTLSSYGAADRLGLNARLVREMAGGELSLTLNALDLEAENPGSITSDFRGGDDNERDWTVHDLYLRFRTKKTINQQQGGLRWAGPLSESLRGDFSIYGVRRNLENPIPFNVIDLSRKGGGLRGLIGGTKSTEAGLLNIQGGVDVDLQKDDRTELSASFGTGRPAPGADPALEQDETVRSVGVFLQADLELAGGAVLLAGVRYDNHNFEADDHIITSGNPDDSGTRGMDAFSPSLGVSVPLGERFNLFSSVSSVFETPTTTELANQPNAAGGFNPELDPMTGKSWELGLRGNAASLLAFEVTAYQTNLENELVPFEVQGQEGVTFFRNAGSSRHRGLEATLSAASRNGLVRGDLTYTRTDARFQDYVLDGEDLRDNRVPGVAPGRAQALVRVNPRPWFGEVVLSWVDEVDVTDANSSSAPSYTLLDLRTGLSEVRLRDVLVSPWLAVTNALDEAYITSVVVNATGSRFFEPGPERSLQIGLRARWAGDN